MKDLKTIKETALQLIEQRKFEEFYLYLEAEIPKDHQQLNDLILLSANFYDIKRLGNQRVLKEEDSRVAYNRVYHSSIGFIKGLQKYSPQTHKQSKNQSPYSKQQTPKQAQTKANSEPLSQRNLLILLCILQFLTLLVVIYLATRL